MTTYSAPSDGDITVALAGKILPAAILLLQAKAAGLRQGRRHTARWCMNRCGIGHSWYYELKRMLILAGYLDEDGRIYLPDAATTQRAIMARALALRDAARRRMRKLIQPVRSTPWRTQTKHTSIEEAQKAAHRAYMVARYGPWVLDLPDR